MDRRKFVSVGATALCALPVLGFSSIGKPSADKPAWLVRLIGYNDEQLKDLRQYKITAPGDPFAGGYTNGLGIATPHATVGFLLTACCAISAPESSFYRSQSLMTDIGEAVRALLRLQHSDGTIDLIDTNFHSTPDTAFMVKRLVPVYKLLKQSGTPGVEAALADFKTFFLRAGEALITGGIHTPNHRWVVSAALTKLNEQWPDPRYVSRIDQWFAEHIDLDPDGQYTEKSTYGYSAVVDRVLITVSKGLNRPEILDAVRKNLLMMRYYVHPNGEVVTEASNRQDKGQIGTLENYYYALRYMALLDNNGEFASMCRLIESTSEHKLTEFLNYFLEDLTLWRELPPEKPLPTDYVRSFPYSGVVRIRHGHWDTTILSNNPGWLTFHKGNAVLQAMRVAASFFGKGQFQSETIRQDGHKWILEKKLEGPYFQPYPADKIPPDGDVAKMPKSNRRQSNVQYLDTLVTITESEGGISVEVDITGTDRVPVAMELVFRNGGKLNGVEPYTGRGNAFLFKEDTASYTVGEDTIRFGPGKAEHRAIQLRGALPPVDGQTVYLTGLTPFKHVIQIY